MRWLTGIALVVVALVATFYGTAFYAVGNLVAAARAGDSIALSAQTDLPLLSRSLSKQIIAVYLDQIGAARRPSVMERTLVAAYGATVADALVTKLLTPDVLAQALRTGRFPGVEHPTPGSEMPPLTRLHDANVLELLGRVRTVNPVQLAIRTSDRTDAEHYAAVVLHRSGFTWKLAGLELPRAALRNLASSLPVK